MQNEKVNQNSQNAKLVNLYYFYTSLTLKSVVHQFRLSVSGLVSQVEVSGSGTNHCRKSDFNLWLTGTEIMITGTEIIQTQLLRS